MLIFTLNRFMFLFLFKFRNEILETMNMKNIDDLLKTLMSDYLKRKRHECGLSGKKLGRLLNLSQQHISRYERGKLTIPLS